MYPFKHFSGAALPVSSGCQGLSLLNMKTTCFFGILIFVFPSR